MKTYLNRKKSFLVLILFWFEVTTLSSKPAVASEIWSQSDWSGGIGSALSNQYSAAENIIFSDGSLTLSQAEHWLDTAWRYRKKVTFRNASGETMTAFPALIVLTESNFDFTQIQSDCRDLRITDADGTTLLPYDIELCNAAGHRVVVWTKVPQIDASDIDGVYVYFGNSSARDAQNKISVWDSYARALKFESSPFYDGAHSGVVGSFVNGPDPIPMVSSITSVVGQGLQIDGMNDYIALDDPFPRDVTNRSLKYDGGPLTIQTVVYIDSSENTGGVLVSKPYSGAGQYNYVLSYTPSRQIFFSISGGISSSVPIATPSETTVAISTRTLPAGQRAVIVGMVADNIMHIFVNGEEWASQAVTITHWPPEFRPGYSGDLNLPLTVGTLFPYGTWPKGDVGYSFQGVLDDFSIIHQSRSAHWLEASSRQVLQNDEWVRFAALETPYAARGTLTSNVLCTDGDATVWESSDIHTNEQGVIQMKVRTGENAAMEGASDFSTCRPVTPAASLATNDCVQVGDACAQYQISFEVTDDVPEVSRVSVTYTNASPPPPPPPPPAPTIVERIIERTVMIPADPVVPGTLRVVETDGSTRLLQREGIEDSYTVALSQAPTAPVTVTLTPDAFLIVSPLTLTFTLENWNQPQTVTVRTIGRNLVQLNADAVARIQHASSSDDAHYHNQSLNSLTVIVQPDTSVGGSGGVGGVSESSGGNTGQVGGNIDTVHQNNGNNGGCSLLQAQE